MAPWLIRSSMMKYDVIDNNGYVCTCENLKAAELIKKNALLGG
jgi:hypothetical protein